MAINDRDNMDRIIDGALTGYFEAKPLAGLEQRVLNRIRIAEADRRRSKLLLRLALALASALPMVVIGLRTRHTSVSITDVARAPSHTVQTTPAPAPHTSVAGARVAPGRRGRVATKHAPQVRSLPREQQFPVLAPLTDEERALLALVEHHPEEAQNVFTGTQKRSNEPIEIRPIQVQPLQSDGGR